MSAITELATRLGKAIAESPQAVALRQVRKAVDADPQISEMLKQYRKQAEKIAALEDENKPVEVDDKHKLNELQQKLAASDLFKKFTAAQVEYIDLMRKVNAALEQQLSATEVD